MLVADAIISQQDYLFLHFLFVYYDSGKMVSISQPLGFYEKGCVYGIADEQVLFIM